MADQQLMERCIKSAWNACAAECEKYEGDLMRRTRRREAS